VPFISTSDSGLFQTTAASAHLRIQKVLGEFFYVWSGCQTAGQALINCRTHIRTQKTRGVDFIQGLKRIKKTQEKKIDWYWTLLTVKNGTWKVSRTFVRISCSYRLSQKIVGSVAGKTPANLRKKFRFASLPEHITSGGLELESPVMAEEDCQGESVSI